MDDLTLVPVFVPPLRGGLTVTYCEGVGLLEDMISQFGGIRFRYLELFDVDEVRLLLDACANTLETLRFYPNDPRSRVVSPNNVRVLADAFAGEDLDLSQYRSLRTLEVVARSLVLRRYTSTGGRIVSFVLSTITSPLFSRVVTIYRDSDFPGVRDYSFGEPVVVGRSRDEVLMESAWHDRLFEVIRAIHQVRELQLVLRMEVLDRLGECVMRLMEDAVAAERAKRGFDSTFPEPLVIFRPRGSSQDFPGHANSPLIPHPWVQL